jgi:hypothetical protein
MVLCVRLEPRLDPNEMLMENFSERPTISFRSDDEIGSSLTLGRGNLTGIADTDIDESVFSLSFDEASISEHSVKATLLSKSDNVYVNGMPWDGSVQNMIFLSSGDTVSLEELRYEYRIHISSDSSPEGSTSQTMAKRSSQQEETISVSSTPEPPPLPKRLADPESIPISTHTASCLSEEISCSVCLEIQVYPRTLNPCGHSFCTPCVKPLKQCPQCRKTIESHVPARQLDCLITTLVDVPVLLERDDVEHYHERKKATPQIVSCQLDGKHKPFAICAKQSSYLLFLFFALSVCYSKMPLSANDPRNVQGAKGS